LTKSVTTVTNHPN